MANLKLGKLPDHTPVKLSITVTKELHATLEAYAALYASTYQTEERLADLIPAMLAAFLQNDRGFARLRKSSRRGK